MLAQRILRFYALVTHYGVGSVRQRVLEEVGVWLGHLGEVIDEHSEELLHAKWRERRQQG